ncbi:MAG: thioredoxin domain-containing protein, partial [Sulfuricurvum sp.]
GAFTTVAEMDDGTYPSALGVMVNVLQSLGILVDQKYSYFAFKSLEYISMKLMKTPIYYPTLTIEVIRYLKNQRLIKSNSENLSRITAPLNYPFVLLKNDNLLDQFIICGENSCFTSTQQKEQLDDLILSTL